MKKVAGWLTRNRMWYAFVLHVVGMVAPSILGCLALTAEALVLAFADMRALGQRTPDGSLWHETDEGRRNLWGFIAWHFVLLISITIKVVLG